MASAKRGDRRLIGVVFGGRSSKSRNDHMAELLDKGFGSPRKGNVPKIDLSRLPELPTDKPSRIDLAHNDINTTPSYPDGNLVPVRKPVMAPPAGIAASGPEPVINQAPSAQTMDGLLGTLSQTAPAASATTVSAAPEAPVVDTKWSVQIGAYQSRDATDRALYDAMRALPSDVSAGITPVVAPLKTVENGWLFRARLGNLEAEQARRVCTYFRGCLLIPPQ